MPVVIAIDGPSASGKGTIARKLAAQLGFAHLDTGLLYRAVWLAVLRAGGDPADARLAEKAALALDPAQVTHLGDDDALRSDEASVAASKAAAIPAVRAALLKFQKDFCLSPPGGKKGAVLDGRDIGTVIAPDAPVKIFVTASAEARSLRRFKELQGRGQNATYAAVLADMKERDARDAERTIAPTKPAHDAVMLDTTAINAEQALAEAVNIVNNKLVIKEKNHD
ncbi:MAG: (d)CMP kinase [Alphaproteobacteria bacterium]